MVNEGKESRKRGREFSISTLDTNESVNFQFSPSSPSPPPLSWRMTNDVLPVYPSMLPQINNQPSLAQVDGFSSLDDRIQAQAHGQQQLQRENLGHFWHRKITEIDQMTDFKHHHLPLTRIKRAMKSHEGVKMVRAEAAVLVAKACELFISELTHKSWLNTQQDERIVLRRSDISKAITGGNSLNVPPVAENDKDEGNIRAIGEDGSHHNCGFYGDGSIRPS